MNAMKQILTLCALICTLSLGAKVRLMELPEMVYSTQPAVINGVIKGYTTTNKEAVVVRYYDFDSQSQQTVNGAISTISPSKPADGTFTISVPLKHTDRVEVMFRDKTFVILLNPGEEIPMTVDMKLLYQAGAKKPAVTFGGTLADFNDDFVQYSGIYDSAAGIPNIDIEKTKDMTLDQFKHHLFTQYQAAAKKLNEDKRLCGAFKQYVNATYQYRVLSQLYSFPRQQQAALGKQEPTPVPDNYYSELKEWEPFNNYGIVYAFVTASQAANIARAFGQSTIGQPFTTPKGYEQLSKAYIYRASITNGIPLKDEQVADVESSCPVLKEIILKENAKLVAHIEENRRNPQYFVKDFDPTLEGEDIFKALIAPYKGKPLLVDFWATWCGPCKAAMKTILPVKEELKGKVNFIYLTGPTSPKDAWEAQIPDIHGDHYYVTAEQYSALLKQFESQGIPTYVVVDKDGNIVNKHIGYPGNDVIKEELTK